MQSHSFFKRHSNRPTRHWWHSVFQKSNSCCPFLRSTFSAAVNASGHSGLFPHHQDPLQIFKSSLRTSRQAYQVHSLKSDFIHCGLEENWPVHFQALRETSETSHQPFPSWRVDTSFWLRRIWSHMVQHFRSSSNCGSFKRQRQPMPSLGNHRYPVFFPFFIWLVYLG